ncbi:hypothetical protein [Mesorhizobium sp. STM 4661]|uniref:hypothetical protein n=1 Tax=Mesorhizobium sp. STM 4661 TaxID=1297570 RepID=UPI0012F70C94|nr:hypothetical protein [Mesorhizobium sp. STM 4661]
MLVSVTAPGQAAEFRVFEDLFFEGGPKDFRQFGLEHMTIVSPHILGPDVPNADQAKKAIEKPRDGNHLVIDIESWPLEGDGQGLTISKYQQTLAALKKADPSVRLGLYSVLPVRDYWRANGANGESGFSAWQGANSQLAAGLIPYVDDLYPSLYTFYGDKDAWVVYAEANLKEARRISSGKPVYCFLWPQFHKTYAFLPGDYWYAQLDTCRRMADGIVIWGTIRGAGPYQPMKWDEKAEWWQATLRFLREQNP